MGEKLMDLVDRLDKSSQDVRYPVHAAEWWRISIALRLASAWLELDPVYPKDAEISISLKAREAFRRALEGSPE